MKAAIIFEGTIGDRITTFIDKVLAERPPEDVCYFIFNDRIVKVDPPDNAASLYAKWMNANRENCRGFYAA